MNSGDIIPVARFAGEAIIIRKLLWKKEKVAIKHLKAGSITKRWPASQSG